jgi:hypothetical protein
MSLQLILFGITASAIIVGCIFFVIFGQITVRKLRKNPATKNELGIEFVSGWDSINVATALALPRKYSRWRKKAPLGALHADLDILEKYTTRFDKILAKIFF